MTARDELAEIIYDAWREEEPRDSADIATAAILAAGYHKPRTITTSDELNALPVGSVVLYRDRAFQHYPAHPAPFDEYQQWKCADGGFVRSTKDGSSILPAIVIHEAAL